MLHLKKQNLEDAILLKLTLQIPNLKELTFLALILRKLIYIELHLLVQSLEKLTLQRLISKMLI